MQYFVLEGKEGCGRSSSIDEDELKASVEADLLRTVLKLAYKLGVRIATISRHLNRVGKRKKLDKLVPHELNKSRKKRRYEVYFTLLLYDAI